MPQCCMSYQFAAHDYKLWCDVQSQPRIHLPDAKAKALMERIQNAGTEVGEAKVGSPVSSQLLQSQCSTVVPVIRQEAEQSSSSLRARAARADKPMNVYLHGPAMMVSAPLAGWQGLCNPLHGICGCQVCRVLLEGHTGRAWCGGVRLCLKPPHRSTFLCQPTTTGSEWHCGMQVSPALWTVTEC